MKEREAFPGELGTRHRSVKPFMSAQDLLEKYTAVLEIHSVLSNLVHYRRGCREQDNGGSV